MHDWRSTMKTWTEERGILRFADTQFGFQPDKWQELVMLDFEDPRPSHRRIAMQACAGPGKTCIEAICGWWFLSTQGSIGEHPKGAATSVTKDNLRDNLWTEFAKWHAVSPFIRNTFTWTSSRIFANDHPETWWLSARPWPKSANDSEIGKTLSGLHSKYVVIFGDESGGIPPSIGRAAEQAMVGTIFAKVMQGGNPMSRKSMLFDSVHNQPHLWRVHIVTGDPDNPLAWVHAPRFANMANPPVEWAREQIETHGRENPWVQCYILGQFPPGDINALLDDIEVREAMARSVDEGVYSWQQKRLGVDVARFGDDRTVIFPRQGVVAFRPRTMRHRDTVAIAGQVAKAMKDWDAEIALIDDTGHWGHGVFDNLRAGGLPALGIQFQDTKTHDKRYKNRRSEMWMQMAEWVKGGGCLPNVPELIAELTEPTYLFVNGKFQLEEKDQIKKRLGRSPDLGDALALTFALPDMPAKSVMKNRRQPHARRHEDEFDEQVTGRGRAITQEDLDDWDKQRVR